MARKGKGRQATRNGGIPAWLLVLIGIIIGAIGMALVMRMGHMPISRPDQSPQPNSAASQDHAGPGIAAKPTSSQPRYDFYSVLPEKEVVIPDAQLSAAAKAEQQAGNSTSQNGSQPTSTQTQASTSKGQYLLQIASFSSSSQANAMKAKLALKGFRAAIQPASIHGATWYRVRLGPYASASTLEADKQKLEADGFKHVIALKEH